MGKKADIAPQLLREMFDGIARPPYDIDVAEMKKVITLLYRTEPKEIYVADNPSEFTMVVSMLSEYQRYAVSHQIQGYVYVPQEQQEVLQMFYSGQRDLQNRLDSGAYIDKPKLGRDIACKMLGADPSNPWLELVPGYQRFDPWRLFYDITLYTPVLSNRLIAAVDGKKNKRAVVEGLEYLYANAFSVAVYGDFAVVCRKPSVFDVNDEAQLHNDHGPAAVFGDQKIYAIRGQVVPADWIEKKDSIDPKDILRERNAELRIIGASLVGWPKMLEKLKYRVIDDPKNPDIGQLIEVDIDTWTTARFLKAECPRNGTIVEGVPDWSEIDDEEIDTALEAQAWRIGMSRYDYQHPPRRT